MPFVAFFLGLILAAVLLESFGEKPFLVLLGALVAVIFERMVRNPRAGQSFNLPPQLPERSGDYAPWPAPNVTNYGFGASAGLRPEAAPAPGAFSAPSAMPIPSEQPNATPPEQPNAAPLARANATATWNPVKADVQRPADEPEASNRAQFFASEPADMAGRASPKPPQLPEPPQVPEATYGWQAQATEQTLPPRQSRPAAAQPAYASPAMEFQNRQPSSAPELPGWMSGLLSLENWPIKLAMILILVALASGYRYLSERGYFNLPMGYRLLGVSALAIAALVFGYLKRESHRSFSLSVQGASLASLLLTIYAALQLYQLIPGGLAFGMMLAVVATGVVLAVKQDALWLALFAQIGGFAAPMLASTGGGSHVQLFGFYLILNLGMLGIALQKGWRALNVVGALATFGIGLTWGARFYHPEYFASVEPFVLAFFAIYVAITVLYTLRHEPEIVLDGVLIFGVPLATFTAQQGLLANPKHLGLFCLVVGLLYGGMGYALRARAELLAQCFLVLAVSFLTFSIPLFFDAQVTSALWALEGAGVLWLGLKQRRQIPIAVGLGLQVMAAVSYLSELGSAPADPMWLNARFVGAMLLAIAAYVCSYLLEGAEADGEPLAVQPGSSMSSGLQLLSMFTGFMSVAWLVLGLGLEIDRHVEPSFKLAAVVIAVAIAQLCFALLRKTLFRQNTVWVSLLGVASLVLWVTLFKSQVDFGIDRGLQAGRELAMLIFNISALATLWLLKPSDPSEFAQPRSGMALWPLGSQLTHGAWLLGLCWMFASSGSLSGLGDGLRFALQLLPFVAVFAALAARLPLIVWPFGEAYWDEKRGLGSVLTQLWAIGLFAAVVYGSLLRGNANPVAFIPVFNPLELMLLATCWILWRFATTEADAAPQGYGFPAASAPNGVSPETRIQLLAAGGFWLLSTMGLRTIIQIFDPSLESIGAAFFSRIGQAMLAVMWSLLGCGAMLYGHHRQSRKLWLAGASLMAVVIGKMLLVDRHNLDELYGILATLAVGLLLAAVGYFAPAPPADDGHSDAGQVPPRPSGSGSGSGSNRANVGSGAVPGGPPPLEQRSAGPRPAGETVPPKLPPEEPRG